MAEMAFVAGPFRPPDEDHRRAAADPTRNVVLRASAGTGKTTVLTHRYLRLVHCGVPPRNILALTFTRKAASEMKNRIVAELANPDRRRELAGRTDIAEVNISTLDAFTLGLIREFPLDAGVSPGIEILDERSMPVVWAEAIQRVFSGATGFDRETLGLLPLLLDRSQAKVEEAVRNYLDRRLVWRKNFEEQAGAARSRGAPAPPRLRTFFEAAAPSCKRLRAAALDGLPGVEMPLTVRLALALEEQDSSRDALDREALEGYFPTRRKTPRPGFPAALKQDFISVAGRVKAFQTVWLDSLNERAFDPLWELFQAVEAEYQRLKKARGVMDFDDLTITATRLLEGLGEFSGSRFRLEARYHHLLLDEFHDTSDHQWDLLRALIRPWTEGMGLAAEEVQRVTRGRLSRPTIFVVGDHKQSIYRFRDARVEILSLAEAEIEKLLEPGDRPDSRADSRPDSRVVLKWNFRSVQRLRRFVNTASRKIAEAAKVDPNEEWAFRYDDDDVLPEGEGPADAKPGGRSALAVAVAANHEEAARRIAERIRLVVREDGVPPEEVAILARTSSKLHIYQEAVERLGIPTYLLKGGGFFKTPEVRDLQALSRFLARPHSDRRAVELLRSRFFALPGDDLARLRRASGAPTPFSDLLRSGGGDLPATLDEEAADRLRDAGRAASPWIALSRRLPPSRTVARILEETRYLERALAAAGAAPHRARQAAANVQKALQHLRAFERGGFASMEMVAERLAAAADGDSTQAPVRAGGAVQALSIHAAKGLEFDQVFLVDCGGQGRGDTGIPRVRESGAGQWSIALIKDAAPWKLDDGGRAESEERRCLYVAMTRARRSLALSWTTRFKGDGLPWKPRGLAGLLPADLFLAASLTASPTAESAPKVTWAGHEIEVLPSPDDLTPGEMAPGDIARGETASGETA